MEYCLISKVAIDKAGRLQVFPQRRSFELIYRSAMEIHWDENIHCLYAPDRIEWSSVQWFQRILDAVRSEYGCRLYLDGSTDWNNISKEAKSLIEKNHPDNPGSAQSKYEEIQNCLAILNGKVNWFFRDNNLSGKIKSLEWLKKSNISFVPNIIGLLKDNNFVIKLKSAETIIHLIQQAKHQNELYGSLKYCQIELADFAEYKRVFSREIYIHILAIASLNCSGYVREKALKEFEKSDDPTAIRYILLRLGDWVPEVRAEARRVLGSFYQPKYLSMFIEQLPLIDWLMTVQRTDLLEVYNEITRYICGFDLTPDFFDKIRKFNDKIRFTYFKTYLKLKEIDETILKLINSDAGCLVREELIDHIKKFDLNTQLKMFRLWFCDRASKVRVKALYESGNYVDELYPSVLLAASDESTSVRETARFMLRSRNIDFGAIYRRQLLQNARICGSILGLAEVGLPEDVKIFESFISNGSPKIKLACLSALNRIAPSAAKNHALELFVHRNRKLRNLCVEILSKDPDDDLLYKARNIYAEGEFKIRMSVLNLFKNIGGYRVLADFIIALSDSSTEIQTIGWIRLKEWREKASRRSVIPSKSDVLRATDEYQKFSKKQIELSYHHGKLWDELLLFLKEQV